MTDKRKLTDLVSVGPAIAADFEDLGITEVGQLVDRDAGELYEELQRLKGKKMDPCVLDVFRAAIEQARDPKLPEKKKHWHYWSKVRKGQIK